jgi:hypothetical protein
MLRDVFKGRARLRIPIKGPFSSKWLKLGVSSLITRPPPKSINTTFRNKIEATETTLVRVVGELAALASSSRYGANHHGHSSCATGFDF